MTVIAKPKRERIDDVAAASWPFASCEIYAPDAFDRRGHEAFVTVPKVAFHVPGPPVPKERPRVVRANGGRSRAITPAATIAYEAKVRAYAFVGLASVGAGAWPRGGWASRRVRYALQVEARLERDAGDADNIAKSICDACNGLLWPDDVRVCLLLVAKRVAAEGGAVGVDVTCWAVGPTKEVLLCDWWSSRVRSLAT